MTTAPLLAAIDDTIEIVAARFDHVLELLVAEHRRLEQLAGMRELAEQLDPSSPPDAAAEPADTHGQDTHAAAAPAPPAAALPTDERTQAPEHTPPPAARSVGHVPEPPARRADRAGGTGSVGRDGLTEKQSALVTAVNSLGECTLSQICEHVGRVGEEVAVRSALLTLRDRGLIQHNGKNSRAGRWQRTGGGIPRNSPQRRQGATGGPPIAPGAGLNGSLEQRVELALKWAKTPLKFDAIVTRCKATSVEREQVQEALAYMEADGRATCDDAGRWSRTDRLAEAA